MDIRIDLTDVDTPAQARQRLSEALPLPENKAWNLDALYDFLTERAAGWRVVFTGCAGAEERLPSYMRSLRRMCRDAEEEMPELYIAFLP